MKEIVELNNEVVKELIYSKDLSFRIEAARQGCSLDILMNDPDPRVRIEVAKQGYALDILMNDGNQDVRWAAWAATWDGNYTF